MIDYLAIVNARILTPMRLIDNGVVLVAGERIQAVDVGSNIVIPDRAMVYDAKGQWVAPGFIEGHVHGGGGGDLMSGDPQQVITCAKTHARGGTTAFLATTLTAPIAEIVRALQAIQVAAETSYDGAAIIGAHLEGPYLNRTQAGAQNPDYLKNPDLDEIMGVLDQFPLIQRMSVAPELPGASELGQELRRRGIVASIAHSDATYQEILKAVENGYTHVTHMYSGMSSVKRVDAYRVAGVVEAVLSLDELSAEIIGDGHHVPPSMIKMLLRAKGTTQVALTTDAIYAAGLEPGTGTLFGLPIIVDDERPPSFELPDKKGHYVAKLADRSAFAGSVATMDHVIRTMTSPAVGLSLRDAVKMATIVPARIHGIANQRGMLAPGMIGDIVVFDEHIRVKLTVVRGRIVFRDSNA